MTDAAPKPPIELETAVLIVGAGPTGLAASIGLSHAGTASLLIERHPGTSIHPKARGVNVRTMEILRQWGVDGAVRTSGLSPEANGFFFRGASLLAEHFERSGGGGLAADAQVLSPETWMVISQDVLEPVMLEAARGFDGADLRFGHELVALDQDAAGVTAVVRERAADRLIGIRARWVVGADGAESAVRGAAGIELDGHGPLVDNVSILFEAPLGDRIDDRRSAVYYLSDDFTARPRGYPMSVGNPPDHGVLLTVDNADRWLLVVAGDISTIDEATAIGRIHGALGRDDLPVRILGFMAWSPAARVATRYATGRLFVAGDAAHQMTPSGAFGLNVGIADAHNLAWKLAAVESGWAARTLLETYDAERRPAGLFATEQSYLQFLGTRPAKPFGNWGVILGTRYVSKAVLPDGTRPPEVADPAVDYVPNAHPGARAPHAWLVRNRRRISTLDLYGQGFTCVVGRDGQGWAQQTEQIARSSRIPITSHQLGPHLSAEDAGRFALDHGIGDEGALVVRPDGHVAWRSPGAALEGQPGIAEVLRQVVRSEGSDW
ncbi:MAG: FAD-dependent monooxygenase [Candidatus Limnocylindrales bacterium]